MPGAAAVGHRLMSAFAGDPLPIWTVYENPRDYPGQFVARKWLAGRRVQATDEVRVAQSLQQLRECLPPGLVCLQRQDGDDPAIVEVWM